MGLDDTQYIRLGTARGRGRHLQHVRGKHVFASMRAQLIGPLEDRPAENLIRAGQCIVVSKIF